MQTARNHACESFPCTNWSPHSRGSPRCARRPGNTRSQPPSRPRRPPARRAAQIYTGRDDRDLDEPAAGFDAIPDALAAIAAGEAVVVLDDEDRENEGDLILAADRVSAGAMAFVVNHTSGVVCVGMEGADLDRLRIPLMVSSAENEEAMCTAFTVTVDLREGTSTGISAADRAATLLALADPAARPEDFKRPGHIFPLRYRQARRGAIGGVLRRPGHTEASVDLARLAGCRPAGVLCEIVNPDGSMARTPQLLAFAREHGLRVITIADLIRYRLKHDRLVEATVVAELPTRYGPFTARAYRSLLDGTEHLALVAGHVRGSEGVLARVHSESMLGDVFGSQRCDSGPQLDAALAAMAATGAGVLVYLRGQQGRGLGLAEELEAYAASACDLAGGAACDSSPLEDGAFPVDARDYGVAAHILRDLGVKSVRLLTSNPAKSNSLKAHGIRVLECLSTGVLGASDSNGAPYATPVAAAGSSSSGGGSSSSGSSGGSSGGSSSTGRHLPPRSRTGVEAHFV
eukprot:scaffold21.g2081.t1